ncbi:hypothetical protein SH449x_004004 [Pirellulaceae bacterium SH449]
MLAAKGAGRNRALDILPAIKCGISHHIDRKEGREFFKSLAFTELFE